MHGWTITTTGLVALLALSTAACGRAMPSATPPTTLITSTTGSTAPTPPRVEHGRAHPRPCLTGRHAVALSASASPEQVVGTFVGCLDAGDRPAAVSLCLDRCLSGEVPAAGLVVDGPSCPADRDGYGMGTNGYRFVESVPVFTPDGGTRRAVVVLRGGRSEPWAVLDLVPAAHACA